MSSSLASPAGRPVAAHQIALVFVLVLFSAGNPAVLPWDNGEITLIPATAVLLVVFASVAMRRITRMDVAVFATFLALTFTHLVSVPGASPVTAAGFFVRLFMGYAVARLVTDLPVVLVRVLAGVAALAVGIFGMQQLFALVGIDLADLLAPIAIKFGPAEAVHVVVHNFNSPIDRDRNAGLYWEPGALSGYSLLGLVLLCACQHLFSARQRVAYAAALVTAVLTTFSTTGYVILPLVLLLYLLVRQGGRLSARFVIVAAAALPALTAAGALISELPFVRAKIQEQVLAVATERGDWQLNRIGQFVSDLQDIAERPLTGWSANPRLRPSAADLDEEVQTAQGNGLSNFVVKFGLVGLGAFMYFAGTSLRRYSGIGGAAVAFAVLLMVVLLVGETFLDYPLYLALMFVPLAGERRWLVIPLGVSTDDAGRTKPSVARVPDVG